MTTKEQPEQLLVPYSVVGMHDASDRDKGDFGGVYHARSPAEAEHLFRLGRIVEVHAGAIPLSDEDWERVYSTHSDEAFKALVSSISEGEEGLADFLQDEYDAPLITDVTEGANLWAAPDLLKAVESVLHAERDGTVSLPSELQETLFAAATLGWGFEQSGREAYREIFEDQRKARADTESGESPGME